jgi:hypothetical protein
MDRDETQGNRTPRIDVTDHIDGTPGIDLQASATIT